ncbi:MAG: response regulator transcription factor, partial [Bacteroidales bacterium]|nr:response regulator transcription factor [Bacteroidales bacterium]
MKKITLLLADDHEIFRNGVEYLINKEEDMSVVATASNGEEAVRTCISVQPQVVLMDIAMPVL